MSHRSTQTCNRWEMEKTELVKYLNKYLDIYRYQDYGPNGLQIDGKDSIKKVAFAVSATLESVEQSVAWGADALIVHHGLFWKFHGARAIKGAHGKRVISLIKNDINLFGFHLPLDGHPEIGNAAMIAHQLDGKIRRGFGDHEGMPTGVEFEFTRPQNAGELKLKLETILGHQVIHADVPGKKIETMGIITGGANSQWKDAFYQGLDSYLTGEISEHDWHDASEAGIHFFAGGHNATEQFGVQGLMKHLMEKFDVECTYFPSENPA